MHVEKFSDRAHIRVSWFFSLMIYKLSYIFGASLVAQMQRICLYWGRLRFNPWVWKIPWRREWLHTPVFLLGEFHERRSLVGYNPWGHKESGTTEWLILSLFFTIYISVWFPFSCQDGHTFTSHTHTLQFSETDCSAISLGIKKP